MWWVLVLLVARGETPLDDEVFWWGDPHAHTGASGDGGATDVGRCDGECGAVSDLELNARLAGLDWFSATDHVDGPFTATVEDFATVLAEELDIQARGDIVVVPGAELNLAYEDGRWAGHRNLMFFGTNAQLAGLTLEDTQIGGGDGVVPTCDDIYAYVADLEDRVGPVLFIPHHPAAIHPRVVDWSCHDPLWAPAVEVYSEHGSSMGDGLGYDPLWSGTASRGTVHHALQAYGYRLGFLAGTDRHDTHPGAVCALDSEWTNHPYGGGLTGVILRDGEPLSRMAIYEAFVERRTVATTGVRVPLRVEYRSAGAWLGEHGADLRFPAAQPLEVIARVPAALVDHVRDVDVVAGATTWSMGPPQGPATWRLTLESPPAWLYVRVALDGEGIYGVDGCMDGGEDTVELVWSSPAFVDDGPGDLDGDGLTWAEGDCDDGDAGRSPELAEVCGDDIDQDCDGEPDDLDPDCGGPARADPLDLPSGSSSAWDDPPDTPGGCSHGAGQWLPLFLLILWRRRRRTD